MKEIWRNIPEWEGFYSISNTGQVKSSDRFVKGKNGSLRFIPGKTRKQSLLKCGYLTVVLRVCGKVKTYYVHRLVAQTFLPNPFNLCEVNHKDEIKTNNFVWVNDDGSVDADKSNLEWCNRDYNAHYGSAITKRCRQVIQRTLDGKIVRVWNSISEARKQGFDDAGKCCRGNAKTCKGYKFEYLTRSFRLYALSPLPVQP